MSSGREMKKFNTEKCPCDTELWYVSFFNEVEKMVINKSVKFYGKDKTEKMLLRNGKTVNENSIISLLKVLLWRLK
jgi:hypothetical protein